MTTSFSALLATMRLSIGTLVAVGCSTPAIQRTASESRSNTTVDQAAKDEPISPRSTLDTRRFAESVIATSEYDIDIMQSGNGMLLWTILTSNCTEPAKGRLKSPSPSFAYVSGDTCEVWRGEDVFPDLGHVSLNDDPELRWGIRTEIPLDDLSEPHPAYRSVSGGGITRGGSPWVAFLTEGLVVDVYVRRVGKWRRVNSINTRADVFYAVPVSGEDNVDVVSMERAYNAAKRRHETHVRLWTFLNDDKQVSVKTVMEINSAEEILTVDARSARDVIYRTIQRTAPDGFVVGRIDAVTKSWRIEMNKTSIVPLYASCWELHKSSSWDGIQDWTTESVNLWQVDLVPDGQSHKDDSLSPGTTVSLPSRLDNLLRNTKSHTCNVKLTNSGRPFLASQGAGGLRTLTSDEPVKKPCLFATDPELRSGCEARRRRRW